MCELNHLTKRTFDQDSVVHCFSYRAKDSCSLKTFNKDLQLVQINSLVQNIFTQVIQRRIAVDLFDNQFCF